MVKTWNFSRSVLLTVIMVVFLIAGCYSDPVPRDIDLNRFSHTSVQLPSHFGDNMVLQRNIPIPIRGKAAPGDTITAYLGNIKASAIAGLDGDFNISFPATPASGPYDLVVIGQETKAARFKNVMVGDVWLCAGQSNMDMTVGAHQVQNYKYELAHANNPNIRLMKVSRYMNGSPLSEISTLGWAACDSCHLYDFSAAGYFFGREIERTQKIAVGLIHCAWGGTPIESWISTDALKHEETYLPFLNSQSENMIDMDIALRQYKEEIAIWESRLKNEDPGYKRNLPLWGDPEVQANGFQPVELLLSFSQMSIEESDATYWFRKEVTVPESWANRDLILDLGQIDDWDMTFFNGHKIGENRAYGANRSYRVPGKYVKAGSNLITIRLINLYHNGGFHGDVEHLALKPVGMNDEDHISLTWDWEYQKGMDLAHLGPYPAKPAIGPNTISGIYNGMIAPLTDFPIRGIIWYQGESNAGRAFQYRRLFPALIRDWRSAWGEGNIPFIYVQLANYLAATTVPVESAWAELREAQLMALSEPSTEMVVTIDIGDAKNIHPKNKQEVGRRLALAARHLTYDEELVYSGPIYDRTMNMGNKIRVFFKYSDNGLVAKGGGRLKGFAIAGEDQQLVWADAVIQGNSVIVSSPKVPSPMWVRYGWANNPVCNLFNKDGLPASPFRTDGWPGLTDSNK